MCDYCDCRSHREIAELSGEHEEMAHLLGPLEAAVRANDRSEAGVAVTALHRLLHGHATREEQGVFAELRAQVEDGYVAMFEHDHVVIHELLERASGDEWASASVELASRLHDHILREESDLFPAAHQLLSAEQWSRIDLKRTEILGPS